MLKIALAAFALLPNLASAEPWEAVPGGEPSTRVAAVNGQELEAQGCQQYGTLGDSFWAVMRCPNGSLHILQEIVPVGVEEFYVPFAGRCTKRGGTVTCYYPARRR